MKRKLQAALDYLKSVRWYPKNNSSNGKGPCVCAYTAMVFVDNGNYLSMAKFFADINGIKNDGYCFGIPEWNDAPERTLVEVYAAFERTIAAAPDNECNKES